MTLGRTSTGAIKIKTDSPGLRAVECGCCITGPCSTLPDVCFNGVEGGGWGEALGGCANEFDVGCVGGNPFIVADGLATMICGGVRFAMVISGDGSTNCFDITGTWFFCKTDGIDSAIGQYGGYAATSGGGQYFNFYVTEKQEGIPC